MDGDGERDLRGVLRRWTDAATRGERPQPFAVEILEQIRVTRRLVKSLQRTISGMEEYMLSKLAADIAMHYDNGELRLLAYGLGVNDQDLRGDTRTERALSLVQHCDRRGGIRLLIEQVRVDRPQVFCD